MSSKKKGDRVERELLDLFTEMGWKAARVAGSGKNDNTYCDLIAGNIERKDMRLKLSRVNIIGFILQKTD